MNDSVLFTVEDGVGWITLNRPEAMNAINDAMREALPAALEVADRDSSVRVIVLRGSGERAFCVGADIKEFKAVASPAVYREERTHRHWIAAFDRCEKPIVASIHGFCLGGGFEIALACDLRIASADARFGFPETSHGIIPAAGGTQRLTRVVGLGVALDLVLTGERMDAQRALALGVVSRVAEGETLDALTRKVATAIAGKPPLATRFAKESVRKGIEMPLESGLRMEVDLFAHLVNTEDRLEAGRAFSEKRPPRFVGR